MSNVMIDKPTTTNETIKFKHVIIDHLGPERPHTKAVSDINGNGLADVIGTNWGGDYQAVELWKNTGSRKSR